MNKAFLNIVFFFCLLKSHGQTNLIYNGDFELYDTCPTNISTPGDYQIEHCLGWYAPTMATSDYFNACAGWPVGVPNNGMGNIIPYSGNAYCGILIEDCKHPGLCVGYWGFWVEYLQSKLNTGLNEGYEYEFNCHIAMTNKVADYAFAKFGAYFSHDAISRSDARPIEVTPQIVNLPPDYLEDTNWTEFKGRFVAQGGEQFITLGFFIDTNSLDTLRIENDWIIDLQHYGTYYFIDGCTLEETGNVYYYPNIFSPNGDGVNDNWEPFVFKSDDVIAIYNRWGQKVFIVDKSNKSWNGNDAVGQKCSDGIYYYAITTGKEKRKGFIQLVR